MNLIGRQRVRLAKELSVAFSPGSFDMFLDYYFDVRARNIAPDVGFEEQCYEVINHFNQGDFQEFYDALEAHKPGLKKTLANILADTGKAVAATSTEIWAPAMNPLDYLHLFDRDDEHDLILEALRKFPVPPPVLPIVVPILAERDDEYSYLIERLNSAAIKDLYQGAPCGSVDIKWTSSATADLEVRKVARAYHRSSVFHADMGSLIRDLSAKLAGVAFRIELVSDQLAVESTVRKLSEFLTIWAQLGPLALPPILYIVVVRDSDPSQPTQSYSLATARATILAACAPLKDKLIVVEPFMLSLCLQKHIDDWRAALANFCKSTAQDAHRRLKEKIKAPKFRLREVQIVLRSAMGINY
jgi:hypothetical protein